VQNQLRYLAPFCEGEARACFVSPKQFMPEVVTLEHQGLIETGDLDTQTIYIDEERSRHSAPFSGPHKVIALRYVGRF